MHAGQVEPIVHFRVGRRVNGMVDAMIIGAGPAGITAALWLGRCRRSTLVFDSGSPRNGASAALHGFLSRDGVSPWELRALGRAELAAYPTVSVFDQNVVAAERLVDGFVVQAADGARHRGRLLLLATGRTDSLPEIPDAQRFYGRGIFHCAYCDGWEHRDEPLAVIGCDDNAVSVAKLLRTWSSDVILCTHGRSSDLDAGGIPVITSALTRLVDAPDGCLGKLEFASGERRDCRALFFCSDCDQKSSLPRDLGCQFDAEGSVVCNAHAATGIPGLFVAGNVRGGIHLAITAAAEGAEAALAMNNWLVEHHNPTRPQHG